MSIRGGLLVTTLVVLGTSACAQAATPVPVTEVPVVKATLESKTENQSGAGGEATFTLDPELSQARFIIGEILANAPNTVIGVNSQVQGGGILNFLEPDLSTLSEFLIDSSGFVTDSNLRNRAIREFILQAGQYPLISFQPTSIVGLPSEVVVGETVSFEVAGLLTIRESTKEVTFAGEATMVAKDRVEGVATATVLRSDFELSIPSVPRVAGVDEEFILEINFVAIEE